MSTTAERGNGAAAPVVQVPHLFVTGDVTLHSGQRSDFKIDCDALTNEELATVARLLARRVGRFGAVEGVPTGGLRLAEAMRPHALVDSDGESVPSAPLLIVDDVLTTGGSMEEHRAGRVAKGAVIFARGGSSRIPHWVTPLFEMKPERSR